MGIEADRREVRRFLPVGREGREEGVSAASIALSERASLTLVQRPRVNDYDAELLALLLGLQQYTLDDRGPSVGEDGVAVLDLLDGVLLDDLASQEDSVTDEGVDLEE